MKRRFFLALFGFIVLMQTATPLMALQCEGMPIDLNVKARATQTTESDALACTLENEGAVHLTGKLVSSLVRSRGHIEARFFNQQGKQLWASRRGPWLGTFSGLALDESFAVPPNATHAHFVAQSENTHKQATGEWRIAGLVVSPGVVVVGEATEGSVITTAQDARWHFSTVPAEAQGEFRIQLDDVAGRTAAERIVRKTAPQTRIDLGKLPVGYYQTTVRFIPERGHAGSWTSALAVLPNDTPPNEPRFGIDAALSWYGGTPDMVTRSVNMMRQAGIGTVRDRLTWSKVQPTRQRIDWGNFETVAKAVAQAGMESVQVFHGSPDWARPENPTREHRQSPPDDRALFEFGQIYANGLGKTVRNIEYWNEQNKVFFFAGYPFQYASGLKAFSAGVKSVDPEIRVLVGAAAGQPGRFFEEIYRNNASSFFDARNHHYHRKNHDKKASLDVFFDENIAVLERDSGVAKFPAWLTEMGFQLHRDQHGNWQKAEREQAEYLVESYALGFATGYERVFFFFWRELIEGDRSTFGIVREDFSPRPAWLALALLTRHLAGASVAAIERHGTGRTVYFRRENNDYLAVTWGGGAAISRLGAAIEIRNIYGQLLNGNSPETNGPSPLLLSRIQSLPVQARQVSLPNQPLHRSIPLRLEARLRVNGNNLPSSPPVGRDNKIAVSVSDGSTVDIVARAVTSDPVPGELTVNCIPGTGLVLLSPARFVSKQSGPKGEAVVCRFRTNLATVGESFAALQASHGQYRDAIRIALIPDAVSVSNNTKSRPLMPNGKCPRWIARHSKNLVLEIKPAQNMPEHCPVTVTSRIDRRGETWVFPAVPIPANELSSASGLRIQVSPVPGWPYPPTPLLLLLVEKSGGVWLVELQRSQDGTLYSGLFKLARPAPWARDDNGRLDIGNLQEIQIGWGGHGGETNQRYGFAVDTIGILRNDP